LERTGPNLHCPPDTSRRDTRVGVAEPCIERLRALVLVAHGQRQPRVAARPRLALARARERGRDAVPPVLRAHLDVLQLGRVGEREVRVAERLLVLPGAEVEAGARG